MAKNLTEDEIKMIVSVESTEAQQQLFKLSEAHFVAESSSAVGAPIKWASHRLLGIPVGDDFCF